MSDYQAVYDATFLALRRVDLTGPVAEQVQLAFSHAGHVAGMAAEAALTLPGWRWLAGMRWHVWRAPPLDDIAGYLVHPLPPGSHPYPGALPDLSDPATAGCLLALLGPAASWVGLAYGTDFACLSEHPVSAGPPPPMTLGAACVAVALRHTCWLGGGDR